MTRVCPTCGTTYDEKHVFCPSDGSALRASDDGSGLLGSVIADRYLILEQLGIGGMGRVYLAQHVRLPQRAAIKVLHPSLSHDTDSLARFNREASNASQISHQHVARVYDFGETGTGLIYLAMEFVPGHTLATLLETEGPFEPRRAARLLRQMAQGLDAAHRLEIVHRDLKPDNILVMIDADGQEQVKVVDFGIAKAMTSETQGVTRAGLVLGTATYMSPEQVSGHVLDRRSDVYALGLVAFVMLTGKLPFQGETAEEAMIMRLTERPMSLDDARPEMAWPAEVQDVIGRALARDPNERYPTAGAFATALEQAVEQWQSGSYPAKESALVSHVLTASDPDASIDLERSHDGLAEMSAAVGNVPLAPAAASTPEVGHGAWRSAPRTRVAMLGGAVVSALLLATIGVLTLRDAGGGSREADARVLDSGGTVSTEAGAEPAVTGDAPGSPNRQLAGATENAVSLEPVRPDRAPLAAPPAGSPTPAEVRPPPAKSERPVVTPNAPARPASDENRLALARLDSIVDDLHPDVIDRPRAEAALVDLRMILPRLTSVDDSVRAELYRAGAYVFLGRVDDACTVLETTRLRASSQSRRQIDAQMDALGCPP
ncbi:MAG TPA: protein kinase [Gemmatimonadaceae bacterium]|nr:protein kinase [Gemmatimonadaceae bacterium]